jgi:RNA polymerase sigma-70 factor (ECF subfamily)
MPDGGTDNSDDLLRRAAAGDGQARGELLARYRDRLRRMIACRMDSRLSARIDPSDVVQDALAEANRQLPDYLSERPLPFYPWLRQIAWNRLVDLHRRHILARRRSVDREVRDWPLLSDGSTFELARRLVAKGSSPSVRLQREEARSRVQQALMQLSERDREILVLRYLEQLSTSETAAVLGIQEGAVKVRHFRALERVRALIDTLGEEHS